MKRKSWSIPEDVKNEVLEMREDGLYPTAISRYLGLPLQMVKYFCNPESQLNRTKRWYMVNREKRLKQMREYSKKHRK